MKKFIILFCIFSNTAGAAIWTTITGAESQGANTRYYYTLWWDDDNDPTPSPCYQAKPGCSLSVSSLNKRGIVYGETSDVASRVKSSPEILAARTMGELRKIYASKIPLPHSGSFLQYEPWATDNLCAALIYTYSTLGEGATGGKLLPTSRCALSPPAKSICEIKTSVIDFSYGPISPEEINGRKLSKSVSVACSEMTSLTIYTYNLSGNNNGEVPLRQDGSITSVLTIDGVRGNLGKRLTVGPIGNSVEFASTLKSSGQVNEGWFGGEALVMLTIH
ncbi:TPA: hypothetical protein ACKP2J_001024 [Serratia marcescens]